MTDLWAFLLQTLTVSGVAVLLLAVKELFRDKLPPRWHFAVWGILLLPLLIPAGLGGRYVLFNWPLVVEVLKSLVFGDYSYTRVLFPSPAPVMKIPKTIAQWAYALYFAGVVVHLFKYALAYLRLRAILRRGWKPDEALMARIRAIADAQKVKIQTVVTVPGLPSAFVCGVFRPVLAIPADADIDDKVLLHELLHLKSRDTVWSIVICFFRCIHWCNPLLVFCANRAGNDLEARCDQRVLEILSGEERRDYGKILLSMANDRFARTPGATCVSNGGRNIRRRIEAIARFRLYPRGMELVSVCAVILLAVPMALGAEATEIIELNTPTPVAVSFASARATVCTTPAGAFDAYGKAILCQNAVYRAMCAPADQQKELAESVVERYEKGHVPYWDTGMASWPHVQAGYYIYNLRQTGDDAFEGMLVFRLNYRPDGLPTEFGQMVVAYQNLRVEKEGHRWVVIPLEEIQWKEVIREEISWAVRSLPGVVYTGTASDIEVNVLVQTIHGIDNTVTETDETNVFFEPATYYDSRPKPNADFSWVRYTHSLSCAHLGSQEQRDAIHHLGVSTAAMDNGGERPDLSAPLVTGSGGGGSNDGSSWSSRKLNPGWGPELDLDGGGGSSPADLAKLALPDAYAADLYINGQRAAELILKPQEGGNP